MSTPPNKRASARHRGRQEQLGMSSAEPLSPDSAGVVFIGVRSLAG